MKRPKLHHEGTGILISFAFLFTLACVATYVFVSLYVFIPVLLLSLVLMGLALNFFRFPVRPNPQADNPRLISTPADGEVVCIEEVYENEFLHRPCLKVSVFMSLYSVHANWFACNGTVTRVEHQEGLFYKAWLPKSSEQNERSAVVIRTAGGDEILERQIAGAVARRIVIYPQPGDEASVSAFLGFIKFGSRVDLFLPPDAQILVKVGDKVKGNITVLGYLPR